MSVPHIGFLQVIPTILPDERMIPIARAPVTTWSIDNIRVIAGENGWTEIDFNEPSRVISFSRNDPFCGCSMRINVYYTTRTVGSALHHPSKGKTQLFRRNIGGIA